MGEVRWSKAGYDNSLDMIAKGLRGEAEDFAREPLPERWVDLIRYLDEKEKRGAKSALAERRTRGPGSN